MGHCGGFDSASKPLAERHAEREVMKDGAIVAIADGVGLHHRYERVAA
jgi:hypothetical protein